MGSYVAISPNSLVAKPRRHAPRYPTSTVLALLMCFDKDNHYKRLRVQGVRCAS